MQSALTSCDAVVPYCLTYFDQESGTVGSHDMDGILGEIETGGMLADEMQHLQGAQVARP